MSDFQPGFLNNTRGGSREAPKPRSRNFFLRFWQDEVVSPDKIEGNVSVAWGVTVFAAGLLFARTVAKDMIVPAL